ncbi:uncharacterized protein ColSpa_11016 [Colletotrichum spaethianum]|uniref:Uncharacterized protein n=1 Tax=Colletotrichum spaethianum TaxID=700344 RepID=A0AA37UPK0_9PEZI|nr:uncharacterized protein ColSpa_11016 [Colletotrichum spaethianum]GKT50835.1 hypothetical protein ColSpa_11016 [Colletotrichum spaethianum]
MRSEKLQPGDLVLVFDEKRVIDKSKARKLTYRWQGPLRVYSVSENSASYRLETLAGDLITRATYAGKRLKRYIENDAGFWELEDPAWAKAKLKDEITPFFPAQDHQDELWEADMAPSPDQDEDIMQTRSRLQQLRLEKENDTLRRELEHWKSSSRLAIDIQPKDSAKDAQYTDMTQQA